jgi:DNA-binding FrmR family transcriptional regulator
MQQHQGTEELTRIINRLARIEGQARGLQRMLTEGRPCEEVFTQLAATKAALDRVGIMLMSLKMKDCLEEEGADAASPEAVEKALETFLKYAQQVK